MKEILYRLQALYQFYKSAHWLAKGEYFYQDHLLFEKLYDGFDDEMDTLVELLLVTTEDDKEFAPKAILKQSIEFLPEFYGDCKKDIKSALKAEHELVKLLGDIANEDKKPESAGIMNFILTLSQNHTHKAYLLMRVLEK